MGNILLQMAEAKDLTPSERHVVEFILSNYRDISSMGIVELGEKTFTSTTTVKRLCHKLGIDSYTDFRMLISSAQTNYVPSINGSADPAASVSRCDSVAEILQKVSQQNAQSIANTAKIIDSETLSEVVRLMANAERVDFYGVGPSNVVAKDAQIKCMRLKIPSGCFSDRVSMLTNAAMALKGTLAFLISYTGETDDIIETAELLRRKNIPTVSITSATSNSVAEICRYRLHVDASESWDRLGGMSSRISTLSLIDAMFTALINSNYEFYIRNMLDTCVDNTRKNI